MNTCSFDKDILRRSAIDTYTKYKCLNTSVDIYLLIYAIRLCFHFYSKYSNIIDEWFYASLISAYFINITSKNWIGWFSHYKKSVKLFKIWLCGRKVARVETFQRLVSTPLLPTTWIFICLPLKIPRWTLLSFTLSQKICNCGSGPS